MKALVINEVDSDAVADSNIPIFKVIDFYGSVQTGRTGF